MTKGYRKPKCDSEKTQILATLRRAANVSQKEASLFFGKSDRDTIADLELGNRIPAEGEYRRPFLAYLIVKLRCRQKQLEDTWRVVMEGEWKWQPLTEDEVAQYFNRQDVPTLPVQKYTGKTVFLAPPHLMHKLVGHGKLLRTLRKRLLAGKHLALTGLPGVGKTTLAIELAHDSLIRACFSDGILWARLGKDANVLGELSKWASQLGIASGQISDVASIDAWVDVIQIALNTRQMLLVADDVWDLETAKVFQMGGPQCVRLLTTRFRKIASRSTNDEIVKIPELNNMEGLKLLRQLAPQAIHTEPTQAEDLVKAVGGLPLALVLMGNYLREEWLDNQPHRIQRALQQLQTVEARLRLKEPQSSAERHTSLQAGTQISVEAIIEISYQTLDPTTQSVFRMLSIFPAKPNSFSEEAALSASALPVETLYTLVDYGLLESVGVGRYTLHQTIVDYAKSYFIDELVYQRMVEFYVDYIEKNETNYEALGLEQANIFACLHMAFVRSMYRLLIRGTNLFTPFLETRGLYTLAEEWLSRALQAARSTNDAVGLTTVLSNLGNVLISHGNPRNAAAYLEEALSLARNTNDAHTISGILLRTGRLASRCGDYQKAGAYYEESLALAHPLGNKRRTSAILMNLGALASAQGNPEQAESYLQESLLLARESDDTKRISEVLNNLAVLASSRGDYKQAEKYYQESLTLSRTVGGFSTVCMALMNLGILADNRGEKGQAKAYWLQALEVARQIGHQARMSLILCNLGWCSIGYGKPAEAETHLQEALSLARAIDQKEYVCAALEALGNLEIGRGYYSMAQSYLQEGVELARKIGHLNRLCGLLEEWGKLHLIQKKLVDSEQAFQEFLEIAKQLKNQERIATALYNLAQVNFALGRFEDAHLKGQESCTIFETIGHVMAVEVREWLEHFSAEESDAKEIQLSTQGCI